MMLNDKQINKVHRTTYQVEVEVVSAQYFSQLTLAMSNEKHNVFRKFMLFFLRRNDEYSNSVIHMII